MISCRHSREVYANRWMRVREDSVTFPNGAEGLFGVVEKPDFVAIVPVDADKRIHLVQQYRYPVAGRYWEIPQGSWEDQPDVDPEQLALAELREETGLRAGKVVRVGHLFQAPGYARQGCHLFVATDLEQGPPSREDTESDMIAQAFGIDQIRRMIMEGAIKDATTIAAFGYLMLVTPFAALFD